MITTLWTNFKLEKSKLWLLSNICFATLERSGSFFRVWHRCSLNRVMRALLVWPTYIISQQFFHLVEYMPECRCSSILSFEPPMMFINFDLLHSLILIFCWRIIGFILPVRTELKLKLAHFVGSFSLMRFKVVCALNNLFRLCAAIKWSTRISVYRSLLFGSFDNVSSY